MTTPAHRSATLLLATAALLAACTTRPPLTQRDGPGADPPPGLAERPDATPRIEPLRSGGPNKPYEVLGQRHVPLTADVPLAETGGASWYGRKFHGLPTASGEPYDMYGMTAAHRTMPIPSYAAVTNPRNGRRVVVRINDRGPFVDGRVIDLSYTAALKLGVLNGVAPVEVRRLTFADIRAGSWGREVASPVPTTLAASASPGPLDSALPTSPQPLALLLDDAAPGDAPPAGHRLVAAARCLPRPRWRRDPAAARAAGGRLATRRHRVQRRRLLPRASRALCQPRRRAERHRSPASPAGRPGRPDRKAMSLSACAAPSVVPIGIETACRPKALRRCSRAHRRQQTW